MANLGQVAGLFVGTSSPTNTNLIWFDSTVSVRYHKVYNSDLNIWEKLNKSSISNKTYSELVTLATGSGLSLGAQYYITNIDVLGIAITTTKINYFDSSDNLVVDDLGSSKSYIVSSANLIIDDIQGVYDENTKKVVFSFQSDVFDGEDYSLAKGIRTNVVRLLKYKWKTIVSSKTNNSVVWDGGIYFNLKATLAYILDTAGGVISYETFVTSNKVLSDQLLALSSNYQNFANNANQTIENGFLPQNLYSKQIHEAPDVSSAAADISIGDSLYVIISKIQRYINKFKRADGILVSESFAPSANTNLNIINSDTVDNSLRKIQAWMNNAEDKFTPIGFVSSFAGFTVPTNWMTCDGQDLAISEFSKLYEILGGPNSPYGVDLSHEPPLFKLPKVPVLGNVISPDRNTLRGLEKIVENYLEPYVIYGLSNGGAFLKIGEGAYRIEAIGAPVTNGQILSVTGAPENTFKAITFVEGTVGGEISHKLTKYELPRENILGILNQTTVNPGEPCMVKKSASGQRVTAGSVDTDGSGSEVNVTDAFPFPPLGNSWSHNNMPPYIVMKYIIRVK